MSKAAWSTLGLSFAFTTSLIYLVHRQQRVEKKAMRATIDAEDEKRNNLKRSEGEVQEIKNRLERNKEDFELQQRLTKELEESNN